MYKSLLICFLSIFLIGCYEKTASKNQLKLISEITKQAPELISFRSIADEKWSRVCFFGPYTQKSTDVLGFDWEVTKETAVGVDDTINVIVFATEKEVTEYVTVPRGKADFWKLSGQCFSRGNAMFFYDRQAKSYLHKNL